MAEWNQGDKTIEGMAALSICKSMLIALNDLKIINDHESRALLEDAAESHRKAIPGSPDSDQHRAVAALIERFIHGGTWVRG